MEPWVIVVIALGTLGVLSLIPAAIKWHAERTIAWFNLRRLELDRPIDQYTRLLLDENGMTGVEVKVCGFWKSLFVGNTYAYRHHTVWLSSWTARRPTRPILPSPVVSWRSQRIVKRADTAPRLSPPIALWNLSRSFWYR